MVQLILGCLFRRVRSALLHGCLDGLENHLMPEYEKFEHDVLVIGAGGAGLRAAIEASAAGVAVGLICNFLLGKAQPVMAVSGIAAVLGMVNSADNWNVHMQ